jgi:hypothetical protein
MTAHEIRTLLLIRANDTTMGPELRAEYAEVRELRVARAPRPADRLAT